MKLLRRIWLKFRNSMQSIWKVLRWAILVLLTILLLSVLVAIEGTSTWELLDLLIVPFVLAVGAWWLNKSERESDKKLSGDRVDAERKIAEERRYQDTLEAYLDRMTELLLKGNLRNSEEDDEVQIIARAQTLTVVRNLDGQRKGYVVQFLYEADLIQRRELPAGELPAIVSLFGADLSGANLAKALLQGADLSGARLSKADLSWANLDNAKLILTDLDEAILRWASLENANLSESLLYKANLGWANLQGTNLMAADIREANLKKARNLKSQQIRDTIFADDAIMPDGRSYEEWERD